MWYTISERTPQGEGDYGSDQRCLVDGPMTIAALEEQVTTLEDAGHHVYVFRGKHRGVLQYQTPQEENHG